MKVVVNHCYGGFGLSSEAIRMLYEMNSPCVEIHKRIDYFKADFNKTSEAQEHFIKQYGLYGPTKDLVVDFNSSSDRHHPDLIKVVETLGEKANGQYAKLKVVDIPDGVNYTVDDYDGVETIREVHRSW